MLGQYRRKQTHPFEQIQQPQPHSRSSTSLSWCCLCCYDTGRISPLNVRKYLGPDFANYETFEPPIRCQRSACGGLWIEFEQVNPQTRIRETSSMPRFAGGTMDEFVSPEDCEAIHQAELQNLRQAQVHEQQWVQTAMEAAMKHKEKLPKSSVFASPGSMLTAGPTGVETVLQAQNCTQERRQAAQERRAVMRQIRRERRLEERAIYGEDSPAPDELNAYAG
ncbi:hypothetical protein [Leptolyngbya sp. FACHB-261]|uniref:hypothetical protein n=1 Tax=Leptolyngbya sp. FACHB-261 TaxID=2692806 RepID=UPI001689746E|nr:hypothetical protein [Leptolyngbya sp. FACHB-261]MBD2105175.1 hypothetical protein [Leptolyngbya sp. FACHB-261]